MDIKITTGEDVERLFRLLCSKKMTIPNTQSDNSYGYLPLSKLTNPSSGDDRHPLIEETKIVRHLISLIPALNKNLDYTESEDSWRSFYCFPTQIQVDQEAEKEKVNKKYIVNASEKSSADFKDRIVKIAREAALNSTNNFIFLSGSTGIGKTTYVKFHTRTQKNAYLKDDVIISRLKFRDLERLIDAKREAASLKHTDSENILSPVDIFESHIIDCLFRDLIESYRIADHSSFKNDFKNQKERLQSAILEAESMIHLLGELKKSDGYLLKSIFSLDEGEQQQISLEIKVAALSIAVKKKFRFAIFLDGFDAIEPEMIKLDKDDESDTFLKCLESVAKGAFSGSGMAYHFLKSAPLVFIVSARPITIAQVKLSRQSEVDIRQETHHSEFLAPSRVFDIIEKRVPLRGNQLGFSIDRENVELLIAVIERCILEMKNDYNSFVPGTLIRIFNYNIRDKIGFLFLLAGFYISKLADHIYESSELRRKIRDKEVSIADYVKKVPIEKIGIARYELEKILFLNRNEKYSNYFVYDLSGDKLKLSPEKGSFDNIYNYRSIHSSTSPDNLKKCPLITKREILGFVIDEKRVQHNELVDWLEDYFKESWSKTDIKLLIRGGMLEGQFEDGVLSYSATAKGVFIFNELQFRYSYFERACMAAALPKYVRKRMHQPQETSGGQWGMSSIINVGVFIRYLNMIEDAHELPFNRRMGAKLTEQFCGTVRALANAGLDSAYPYYASDLESAFEVALS